MGIYEYSKFVLFRFEEELDDVVDEGVIINSSRRRGKSDEDHGYPQKPTPIKSSALAFSISQLFC